MKSKILIVEDDPDMGNLLQGYLEYNGFEVDRVYNGEKARTRLAHTDYDVLVVDVMMPKEDGFTFARKIRASGNETPFIYLTAKHMKEDIITGLKLGADDYVQKPFDPDELVLRIKNLIKRTNKVDKRAKSHTIGRYVFEPDNLSLTSAKGQRFLTEKEAKLLRYLCENQNRIIKREDILKTLWSEADFFNGRSMDVFISRLRKYFSEDESIHIESIRGVGFRFTIAE